MVGPGCHISCSERVRPLATLSPASVGMSVGIEWETNEISRYINMMYEIWESPPSPSNLVRGFQRISIVARACELRAPSNQKTCQNMFLVRSFLFPTALVSATSTPGGEPRVQRFNLVAHNMAANGLTSASEFLDGKSSTFLTVTEFASAARLSRRQIDRLRKARPLGFPREYELGSGKSKHRSCPRFKLCEVQKWLDSRALW